MSPPLLLHLLYTGGMVRFTYKALDEHKQVIKGEEDAPSKVDLYNELKSKGITLITAEDHSKKGNYFKRISNYVSRKTGRVKEEEKIQFARNLGAMLSAGLPISRAISVMEKQTNNLVLKEIFIDIEDSIRRGEGFSSALSTHSRIFSPLFVAMVEASEESGKLPESLSVIASEMEQSYKLRKKIKGALMYPAIIVGVMIIITVLMFIFVVPTLVSTFIELGAELPLSTKVIIFISSIIQNNTWEGALALFILIVGSVLLGRTARGKRMFDALSLRIPIIGNLIKETNSSHTARTLASLLSAGVEVVRCIEITEHVIQNSYYKDVLKELHAKIQKGTPMSDVFRNHEYLYPPFVGEMVLVGEETGELPQILSRVGIYYQEDVTQRTQDFSALIEPLLMVVIGVGVGLFAFSMITPIYSITNAL